MADANEWNRAIIEEFRANGGEVGGQFAGAPLLLLHSTGAKSGQRRVNPVMYQDLGGRYAVFASYAGAPRNPAWFRNVRGKPDVEIEVGTRTERVTARVAEGVERDTIWERQNATTPASPSTRPRPTGGSRWSSWSRRPNPARARRSLASGAHPRAIIVDAA